MTLNLDFTAEQDMLASMVRGLCTELAPLQQVRELEDDADGIARELWHKFSELGLCGSMTPERFGGSEMNLIDGMVIYSELGRSLAPLPHFVSCVLAAGAIVGSGSAEQHAELLHNIAEGSTIATVAWLEPDNGFKPQGVQLTAQHNGNDFMLNGSKVLVPFGAAADVLIVLARTGAKPGDIGLFVVPTDISGVALRQQMTLASDSQYRLDFNEVSVPETGCLGEPTAGWDIWEQVMNPAVVLAAAQAVGGAEYALEITVEYAKNRRQFNKVLAEFQSISHYLADARTTLDGARVLVQEAAWAHSVGRDIRCLAPMAKLFACRAFRDITAMAQQVFGGIGFTLEHDIQLYFRRAKQLQLNWWDSTTCTDKIADSVVGISV